MKDNKEDSKRWMLMFRLFEEGRRRPEVAEVLSLVFQTNITRLKGYFELQIKNGKMRNINPRFASITFVSYFVYTSLVRGVFGDSFLGENDEEIEGLLTYLPKVS